MRSRENRRLRPFVHRSALEHLRDRDYLCMGMSLVIFTPLCLMVSCFNCYGYAADIDTYYFRAAKDIHVIY